MLSVYLNLFNVSIVDNIQACSEISKRIYKFKRNGTCKYFTNTQVTKIRNWVVFVISST